METHTKRRLVASTLMLGCAIIGAYTFHKMNSGYKQPYAAQKAAQVYTAQMAPEPSCDDVREVYHGTNNGITARSTIWPKKECGSNWIVYQIPREDIEYMDVYDGQQPDNQLDRFCAGLSPAGNGLIGLDCKQIISAGGKHPRIYLSYMGTPIQRESEEAIRRQREFDAARKRFNQGRPN